MGLFINIWYVAEVALLFGIVVIIHEFGHFVFAKLFGVKVESFNIGFGTKKQRLWWKKIGETEYSIRPWPLGGFVQLHGHFRPEEMEALEGGSKGEKGGKGEKGEKGGIGGEGGKGEGEEKRSVAEMAYDDVHALREKPYYAKLCVFGAGVVFNFLSVVLVFSFMYVKGREVALPLPAKLDAVEKSSPLYAAGLRSFDNVVAVNGEKVSTAPDFIDRILKAEKAKPFLAPQLSIARDGQTTATVALAQEVTSAGLFLHTGWWMKARIGDLYPGKPADLAGLRQGDVVVDVNGTAIRSWAQMTAIIRASAGKPVAMTVQRGTKELKIQVTPDAVTDGGKTIGQIGMVVDVETKVVRIYNPAKAVKEGFLDAAWGIYTQAMALGKIFGHGNVKEIRDNVAGPVGIITLSFSRAKKGFGELVDFFCLLSLALVIFNILPIPLLDGGHILQATVEAVIRRPIPVRALIFVYNVAFAFLLAFVLFVSFNDFWREGRRFLAPKAKPEVISESPAGATRTRAHTGATSSGAALQPNAAP